MSSKFGGVAVAPTQSRFGGIPVQSYDSSTPQPSYALDTPLRMPSLPEGNPSEGGPISLLHGGGGGEFTTALSQAPDDAARLAQAGVADLSVALAGVEGGGQYGLGPKGESNVGQAVKGLPLPILQAIQDAAVEQSVKGEFPTTAALAHTSLGVAGTLPMMAAFGLAPKPAQALGMLGFGVQQGLDVAPAARALGEQYGLPQAQRDPNVVAQEASRIGQDVGFSLLGARGLYSAEVGRTPERVAQDTGIANDARKKFDVPYQPERFLGFTREQLNSFKDDFGNTLRELGIKPLVGVLTPEERDKIMSRFYADKITGKYTPKGLPSPVYIVPVEGAPIASGTLSPNESQEVTRLSDANLRLQQGDRRYLLDAVAAILEQSKDPTKLEQARALRTQAEALYRGELTQPTQPEETKVLGQQFLSRGIQLPQYNPQTSGEVVPVSKFGGVLDRPGQQVSAQAVAGGYSIPNARQSVLPFQSTVNEFSNKQAAKPEALTEKDQPAKQVSMPLTPKEQVKEQKRLQDSQAGAINLGIVKELVDKVKSGFNPEAKIDGQQIYNRMVNRGFKGEMDATEGLQEFLKEKRTLNEVAKFVQENGPKVEVRKFQNDKQAASQAGQEVARIQHLIETSYQAWYINGPNGESSLHDPKTDTFTEYKTPEEIPDKYKDIRSLLTQYRDNYAKWDTQGKDQTNWQTVAPKPESQMPGYVEVAVVKPLGKKMSNGKLEGDHLVEDASTQQFGESHYFPPNTLGFGRGYMETLPNGKKVFHVIEVQSDWAQRVQRESKMPQYQGEHYEGGTTSSTPTDPLLPHYERLVLKALIDHAREQGADAIAISDAETAMMTQGHDAVAAKITPKSVVNVSRLYGYGGEYDLIRDYGHDWEEGKYVLFNGRYTLRIDRPEVNIGNYKGIEWSEIAKELQPYADKDGNYIPQEPGMLLHYHPERYLKTASDNFVTDNPDNMALQKSLGSRIPKNNPNYLSETRGTLHQIAEELTGAKGEKVSFGKHKMVYTEGRNLDNAGGIVKDKLRKDLIFRNPDGTPKTDVSARVYPLDKAKKDFTMMGSDKPAKSIEGLGKEAGAVNLQSIKDLFSDTSTTLKDKLDELRRTKAAAEAQFGRRKLEGDTLPTMWDRIANTSNIEAQQDVNDPKKWLARNLGTKIDKLTPLQDNALRPAVEAKGDKGFIQSELNKIAGINSKIANDYRKSLNYLNEHWDEYQEPAQRVQAYNKRQVNFENSNGIDTQYLEGYIPRIIDWRDENAVLFDKGGGTGPSGGFMKQRVHETTGDAIKAGHEPLTLSSFDSLEHRYRAGNRRAHVEKMLETLKTVQDPTSKTPVVKELEHKTVQRANGARSLQTQTTPGYTQVFLGNHVVQVHNGYAGLFKTLSGESWFDQNTVGRGLTKVVGAAKHSALLFDTFHLVRLGLYALPHIGREAFKTPQNSMSILDYNDATLNRMAQQGEIPKALLPELKRRRDIAQLGLRAGYNIGRIQENMHANLVRTLPLLKQSFGRYNKFLFDKYQRAIMLEVFTHEFERQKVSNPQLSDIHIARSLARDFNTRFGNLGSQTWMKSKTLQDLLRLVFLAPNWNEGLIRSELGSMKQGAELLLNTAQGKRDVSGMLLKNAGTLFAAYFMVNQAINMMTRGYPTWENKEEGLGSKLSAYMPDLVGSGPGFFLNPLSIASEITHQVVNRVERRNSVREGVKDVVRYKLGPAGRAADIMWSGEDWKHKHLSDWQALGEAAKQAIVVPIQAPALANALSGNEAYPGEAQKTLMSSLGVKADILPPKSEKQVSMEKFGTDKPTLDQRAELKGDQEKYQSVQGLELKDGLKPETKKALGKLVVPGYQSTLSWKGQQLKLTPDELSFYRANILTNYETTFSEHLSDPEFKSLSQKEKQEVVYEAASRAKKDARQTLIDAIESGAIVASNQEKKRFSILGGSSAGR